MSHKRDVQDLVKQLSKAGWRCDLSNGGHWKLFPPNGGKMVVVAQTPSDHRAIKNIRSFIKRMERMERMDSIDNELQSN